MTANLKKRAEETAGLHTEKYTYPTAFELCEKMISFIDQGLIDEKNKKKLLDFASLLPEEFNLPHIEYQLLECPLAADENWGDISFCYNVLNPSFHNLSLLPRPWQSCPAYQQLSLFSKACVEDNLFSEPLNGVNNFIGCEFDIGSSSSHSNPPSIFLTLQEAKKENFWKIINTCAHFFKIPDASLTLLQKCNDALKNDMHIYHLGLMLSRPGSPCKLVIRGKGFNLQEYLEQIDLTNYHADIISIFKSLQSCVYEVRLSLEVIDNKISSKIGLELFIFSLSQTEKEKQWEHCAEILKSHCTLDISKLYKCYEWKGNDAEFIGNSSHSPLFFLVHQRRFSHLKLVFVPKEAVRAKAYFEVKWEVLEKEYQQEVFGKSSK